MARVDLAILQEIVRVVQARTKVPERVRIQKRQYQITYLDDHKQRIEEAIRRHDTDRLNMLFGQLASKVKYQLLRRVTTGKRAPAKRPPAKRTPARVRAARSRPVPTKRPKKRSRAR